MHAGDVGYPQCDDDDKHPVTASVAGIAFVATGALPGANAPLKTVAAFTTYARPIREAVRLPIRANSVRVYLGTYVS